MSPGTPPTALRAGPSGLGHNRGRVGPSAPGLSPPVRRRGSLLTEGQRLLPVGRQAENVNTAHGAAGTVLCVWRVKVYFLLPCTFNVCRFQQQNIF